MQRLQVELLIADHVQDRATCIRHGNCELQDLAQYVGLKENRIFDRALDDICNPEVTTVAQFAPPVRVAFGEEFGMPAGTNVEGQIIATCRKIGIDLVLDTNFGADVALTTREFARLLRREGIELKDLEPSSLDAPHMSAYSGAGAIFGTTGGVMETGSAPSTRWSTARRSTRSR